MDYALHRAKLAQSTNELIIIDCCLETLAKTPEFGQRSELLQVYVLQGVKTQVAKMSAMPTNVTLYQFLQ